MLFAPKRQAVSNRTLVSLTALLKQAEQRWLDLKLKEELKLWKYLDTERPLICTDEKFDLSVKRYIQTFNRILTKICLEQIFQGKKKDYFI